MAEKSLQNARQELKRHVLGSTDNECRILLETIRILAGVERRDCPKSYDASRQRCSRDA